MSIMRVLNEVKDYFDKNICAGMTFKRPPSIEGKDTANYDYQLVEPKTYIMYPPLKDKFPSVTIQIQDGEVNRFTSNGELKLRILLAAWNNGKHEFADGKWMFEQNSDGWKDSFNFLDRVLNILSHTTYFGEYTRLKQEDKLQYGAMKEDGELANYYPYWFAQVSCTVQYGQISSNEDMNDII